MLSQSLWASLFPPPRPLNPLGLLHVQATLLCGLIRRHGVAWVVFPEGINGSLERLKRGSIIPFIRAAQRFICSTQAPAHARGANLSGFAQAGRLFNTVTLRSHGVPPYPKAPQAVSPFRVHVPFLGNIKPSAHRFDSWSPQCENSYPNKRLKRSVYHSKHTRLG